MNTISRSSRRKISRKRSVCPRFPDTRDSTASAQDYADQRYYSNVMARFYSPDPYKASASLSNPLTWNRYAYVHGDPVNYLDPGGTDEIPAAFFPDLVSVTVTSAAPSLVSGWVSGWGRLMGIGGYARYAPFLDVGLARPGGGGGAGGGLSQNDRMVDAAMRASDRLFDPECAGMFLGPSANTIEQRQVLSHQLQYLVDRGDLRLISSSALSQGAPSGVPAFTTATWGMIYVVSGGAFFTNTLNGQPLGGAFEGLSLAQTQELIIIHELLHWEGVGPDTAGQTIQLANGDTVVGSTGISKEVREKCFK